MLFERPWNKEEELLEVMWQTFNTGTFKEKPVVYKKVEGIAPSQPEGKIYYRLVKSTVIKNNDFFFLSNTVQIKINPRSI
jgi:hypothetical protein